MYGETEEIFSHGIIRAPQRTASGCGLRPRLCLQTFQVDGGEQEEECAVCMEVFAKRLVVKGECLHCFHEECLKKWVEVEEKEDCPICRASLVDDIEHCKRISGAVLVV